VIPYIPTVTSFSEKPAASIFNVEDPEDNPKFFRREYLKYLSTADVM
jgi:hypothetical protein